MEKKEFFEIVEKMSDAQFDRLVEFYKSTKNVAKKVSFKIYLSKHDWAKYIDSVNVNEKFAKSFIGGYYYGNKTDEASVGKLILIVEDKGRSSKIVKLVDDPENNNMEVIWSSENNWNYCWIDARNFVAKLFN